MKPTTAFGLAGLVAVVAMAFMGTAPAMGEGTALCDKDPGTGPEKGFVPKGT